MWWGRDRRRGENERGKVSAYAQKHAGEGGDTTPQVVVAHKEGNETER
jgi:hypothetical protein